MKDRPTEIIFMPGFDGVAELRAEFVQQLKVVRPTKGLYVQVSFLDPDPETARAAVNAVMNSYMKIVDEQETVSGNATIKVLENRRQALNNTLNDLRISIQQLTEELGADGLQEKYKLASELLNKQDGLLADLDLESRMRTVLREIQDGTFAREWSGAGPEAEAMLARVKAMRDQLPLSGWEERTRRLFRIGDAASK